MFLFVDVDRDGTATHLYPRCQYSLHCTSDCPRRESAIPEFVSIPDGAMVNLDKLPLVPPEFVTEAKRSIGSTAMPHVKDTAGATTCVRAVEERLYITSLSPVCE